MTDLGYAEDEEGRRERKFFQEIFHSGAPPHFEAAAFPTLFPFGTGTYDEDRPRPVRFKEYREHLMSLSDGRFQQHKAWMEWSASVVEAIERKKKGEDVEMRMDNTSSRESIAEAVASKPQKAVNPQRIRAALQHMVQHNPAYAGLGNVDTVVRERLDEARLAGAVIEECALVSCRKFQCPEAPGLALMRCAGCQMVYYCCKEHQTADWGNHKAMCKANRK